MTKNNINRMVKVEKQKRRAQRTELPQLRLIRRLQLQLQTGAFNRARATEATILSEWPYSSPRSARGISRPPQGASYE